ncbi:MAG: primosomal protein N' [Bacteroidales bacterium]|nr:primosomal protein N' [Bacteroidales bacterium]
MGERKYISVILPLKLEWEPCYSIEAKAEVEDRSEVEVRSEVEDRSKVEVGDRVRVKFAQKEYIGVVSKVDVTPDIDPKKIQPIIQVEDGLERIFPEEIELWRQVSDYYLCSIGETYKAAYPVSKTSLEEARAAAKERAVNSKKKILDSIDAKLVKLQERATKKAEQVEKAKEGTKTRLTHSAILERIQEEIKRTEVAKEIAAENLKAVENGGKPLKSLTGSNSTQHLLGDDGFPESESQEDTIVLSDHQSKAYQEAKAAFGKGKPVLLHGVTGSGKTELYIKLALETLRNGRNVLYLVPEIALSTQLEERLTQHFGERLMTYHSAESAASRRATAEAIRSLKVTKGCEEMNGGKGGEEKNGTKGCEEMNGGKGGEGLKVTKGSEETNGAKDPKETEGAKGAEGAEAPEGAKGAEETYIALGTRSSLFLPHHNLGLIIVDEEHDSSYKQDSPAPRYNGRDTALILSVMHKGNIILGSATPSLEEMYNCLTDRHVMVSLTERYHGSESADIEIIDTRAERRKRGMEGNFSRKLIEHIRRTLSEGGQAMILRSRRAWAPAMQCESCGDIPKCPHCNVSLTQHKQGMMVCHYCGYKAIYTGQCAKCQGPLKSLGAGTQKIEGEAAALFPEAVIARLDSDSAQNKAYEAKVIKEFSQGKIDILIGTQMLTKGFDFSNLKLVAVIAADTMLGMQDFRADEKAMQLLEQFRGRSGRRDEKGLCVIQTSQPEHPVYKRLANGEFANEDLLAERQDFNFPPYTRIVELTIKDIYEDRVERMSKKLAMHILQHSGIRNEGSGLIGSPIVGPYAPVVDKIADQYIRTIRISLKKDRNLRTTKERIKEAVLSFEKVEKYTNHISINVDPA